MFLSYFPLSLCLTDSPNLPCHPTSCSPSLYQRKKQEQQKTKNENQNKLKIIRRKIQKQAKSAQKKLESDLTKHGLI